MKHLLSINDLSSEEILLLIDRAKKLKQNQNQSLKQNRWQQRENNKPKSTIAHLFFEPSTRTAQSFHLASQNLGLTSLLPHLKNGSAQKGESDVDTINTFAAMGAEVIVLRHPSPTLCHEITKILPESTLVLNAGNGADEHPTQALLDLMTISEHFNNWKTLKVCITGDVGYSRVAHSLISGLQTMGVNDINIVSPTFNALSASQATECKKVENLRQGIINADVVISLRRQMERWSKESQTNPDLTSELVDDEQYSAKYMVDEDCWQLASPQAILMHPGPVHDNIDIQTNLRHHPQCVIQQQVRNGVLMRMAVIEYLLAHKNNTVCA